jgi:molybdopterin biosynthesis enzyme
MLISSLLQENVKNIIDMGIAIDDKVILEDKILSTLKNSDILISSGGVSMGELDLLKIILEKIGIILLSSLLF